MNNKEILDIALTVRNAAIKHPEADYDLRCWCAICSFHIFKKIRNKNKRVYFIIVNDKSGFCHCFVLLENKMIDVTATQFGEKEGVIIDDINNIQCCKKWYWNINKMRKFSLIKSIREELEGWPEEQNPFYVDFSC